MESRRGTYLARAAQNRSSSLLLAHPVPAILPIYFGERVKSATMLVRLTTRFPVGACLVALLRGLVSTGLGLGFSVPAAPALLYSTPAQGSDFLGDIKMDVAGNIVLAGVRGQTIGSLWQYDLFITKLNSQGQQLFTKALGGSQNEDSRNFLGLDSAGHIYLAGTTYSPDFPTTNALQPTFSGSAGKGDVYLTKLSADGSNLLFSTFLGGTDSAWVTGLAVDPDGNTAICGQTLSTNFPGVDCIAESSSYRSFVALFSSRGELLFSKCIGAPGFPVNAIAFGPDGNLVIVGDANRARPMRPGDSPPPQTIPSSPGIHIIGLARDGSLRFSRSFGDSSYDSATVVALDPQGNIYVGGTTESTNFPATTSIGEAPPSSSLQSWQSFVLKLDSSGNQVQYSTLIKSLWNVDQLFVDSNGQAEIGSFYGLGPALVAWLAPDGKYFTDAQAVLGGQFLRMSPGPGASLYISGVQCAQQELQGNYVGCRANELVVWRMDRTAAAASHTPPVVGLRVDPSTRIVAGSNVTLTASALDLDGFIQEVSFYSGSVLLGTVTNWPYTFAFNSVPAGTNDLWAAATDDQGAIGASGTVRLIAFNPPDNDQYQNAFEITGTNSTVIGSIAGATSDNLDHIDSPSVWWRWTPPADGVFTVSALGNGFSAGLQVFQNNNSNTPTLLFSGMYHGTLAGQQVSFSATAGESYLFGVYDDFQYTGMIPPSNDYDVTLTIRLANLSPNSSSTNAYELSGSVVTTNVVVLDSLSETSFPMSMVWFMWTAPSSGPYAIGLITSQGYSYSYVSVGFSPDGSYDVTGFSRTDGSNSINGFVLEAEAGHRYYLTVQSQYQINDSILSISPIARPANDNFSNRFSISGAPLIVAGSNIGASAEPGEPLLPNRYYWTPPLPGYQHSVWWDWTAPADGVYRVSVIPASQIGGGAIQTVIQPGYFRFGAFSGGIVSNLLPLSVTPINGDVIKFKAASGASYALDVDTSYSESDFRLQIEEIHPPDNDDLARAARFPSNAVYVSGTLKEATYEPGEPTSTNNGSAGSVWWKWTAPVSSSYYISLSNQYNFSPVNLAVNVYSGTGFGDLTLIASNSAPSSFAVPRLPGSPPTSRPTGFFMAEAGATYYLAVIGGEPLDYSPTFDLRVERTLELQYSNSVPRLKLAGAPGQTNVIEASTDLLYWVPLSTNVNAGSSTWFSDTGAPQFDHRFYRVRPWP